MQGRLISTHLEEDFTEEEVFQLGLKDRVACDGKSMKRALPGLR